MFWTHWRQEGCWRHMCVSCSFFRQSWCLAVYHDRFSDFEQELQQISSATVSAFTFIPNIIKFELDRSLAPFLSFFLHPKGKNVTRNMYKITSNQYNMSGRPSAGGRWRMIFHIFCHETVAVSEQVVCLCRRTSPGSRWGAALWNISPTTVTCCPCSPVRDSCDIAGDITGDITS